VAKRRRSRARIVQCDNYWLVIMAGNELPTDDRDGDTSVEVTDSLMYGLEILGLYKPGVTALSTSEIAKRIGLPQKRARQLIGTLANSRFIVPLCGIAPPEQLIS
jgi:hypothetical protein